MSDTALLRLTVEIEPASEPIAGWVDGSGSRTRFGGVLELLALLDAARTVEGDSPSGSAGRGEREDEQAPPR